MCLPVCSSHQRGGRPRIAASSRTNSTPSRLPPATAADSIDSARISMQTRVVFRRKWIILLSESLYTLPNVSARKKHSGRSIAATTTLLNGTLCNGNNSAPAQTSIRSRSTELFLPLRFWRCPIRSRWRWLERVRMTLLKCVENPIQPHIRDMRPRLSHLHGKLLAEP